MDLKFILFCIFLQTLILADELQLVSEYEGKFGGIGFDDIHKTGIYSKNLGILEFNWGYYGIASPVDLAKIELTLVQLRKNSLDFLTRIDKIIKEENWKSVYGESGFREELHGLLMNDSWKFDARLEKIQNKFKNVFSIFNVKNKIISRQKRGLINAVGRLLNWGFGVATEEQVNKAKFQSASLGSEVVQLLHSNKDLISLVGAEHDRVTEILEHQKNLQNATSKFISQFLLEVNRGDKFRKMSLRTFLMEKISNFHLNNLITLNSLENEIDEYFLNLIDAARGKLNPGLISHVKFGKILKIVEKNLKDSLRFPDCFGKLNHTNYYSLVSTQLVEPRPGKLVLLIEVPILSVNYSFQTYHLTVLRVPIMQQVNATSTLNINTNQIYIINTTLNKGYISTLENLEGCLISIDSIICNPTFFMPMEISELNCLTHVLEKNRIGGGFCKKDVKLNDSVSQMFHLHNSLWAFSIRKPLYLYSDCLDQRKNSKLLLEGLGRINLTEGCQYKLNQNVFFTRIKENTIWNDSLVSVNYPVSVATGFLVTSEPWYNVSIMDVKNFNDEVLQQLKMKLTDEMTYHLDGTLLKKRTMELLNLTNDLINSRQSLGWSFWQEHPSGNDILIYSMISILTLFLFLQIFWTRHQTTIHRQHFENLNEYLRLVRPSNPPTK